MWDKQAANDDGFALKLNPNIQFFHDYNFTPLTNSFCKGSRQGVRVICNMHINLKNKVAGPTNRDFMNISQMNESMNK